MTEPLAFLRSSDPADRARMGGKATALAELAAAEFPVPEFLVVPAEAFAASLAASAPPAPTDASPSARRGESGHDDATRFANLAPEPALLAAILAEVTNWGGDPVAVRSSGVDEDSVSHTFAGQFESYLFVPAAEIGRRIADVWRSGFAPRVLAYRREHGLDAGSAPAVLIQRMIAAETAGVAFSADPVSGRRGIAVVSAVYGLGTALVGGEADADTFHVAEDGTVLQRHIVEKPRAHRPAPDRAEGIVDVAVPPTLVTAPALDDDAIREVATLARRAEAHFGHPQDIEWARVGGVLHLLQARPITALAGIPDPDGTRQIWDNSNIVESYSGITSPLTFTFALAAYEGVYREFCRILGVRAERIEAHSGTFSRMLGHVRGRVYYNLLNWYRVLALLPGFTVNRAFMEKMMGVREGLPDEVAAELAAGGTSRLRDRLDLARAIFQLGVNHVLLGRKIRHFYTRLDQALAPPTRPLARLRLDELAMEYRRLESSLLSHWDAPLINDFFAMIHFGVLGRLTAKWCGDEHGTLQNELIAAQGGIISAEPARRVQGMAALVRAHDDRGRAPQPGTESDGGAEQPTLGERLRTAPLREARRALLELPPLAAAYEDYLARFGDRCLDELKLESSTLEDDPTPLLRAIGHAAAASPAPPMARTADGVGVTGDATARAAATPDRTAADRVGALSPFRRLVFTWVLRNARARVRDRENLRFERTRLFGRVRRIFLEMGRRLAAEGKLGEPRDVFYLEVGELLGFVEGTATTDDLAALASARRARFAVYEAEPPPPRRFETQGAVHLRDGFPVDSAAVRGNAETVAQGDGDLTGLACCPGIVRGPVRVVRDPRGATLSVGEILVAERTDPGWILLFPAAAGLLVERGSLLSHSAIVAREMRIPAIVSIEGLTARLRTGEWVEMDGATGRVRRIPEGGR